GFAIRNYSNNYFEAGLFFRACLSFAFVSENGWNKVLRKRFLSRVAALRGEEKANGGSCSSRLQHKEQNLNML
ncbi:MAG: hypothetical protein JWQ14_2226, partial [Adhaeribacter sp.]|nr:hypothetical protein [Adhaeribacter sp.]